MDGSRQMEGAYTDKGYKDGEFRFYYPNGKLEAQGSYRNNLIYSFWNYYYPNGNKKEKIYYTGDEAAFVITDAFDSTGKSTVKEGTGKFETFVIDFIDRIRYKVAGEFINGERYGTWEYFGYRQDNYELAYQETYSEGKLKKREFYPGFGDEYSYKKRGVFIMKLISEKFPITEVFLIDQNKAAPGLTNMRQELLADTSYANSRDTIGAFRDVEIEASYPGGKWSWNKYLIHSLNPDAGLNEVPPKTKFFTQTVLVQFIVCTDGTVCNVETMNVVLPSLKKEAERVIKHSGKWVPAVKNGKAVKAYRKQPITFEYRIE
jgi:hypothetical protein